MEKMSITIGNADFLGQIPVCCSGHAMGLSDTGMELSLGDAVACGKSGGRFGACESSLRDALGRVSLPGQTRLSAYHHFACGAGFVSYPEELPERLVQELGKLREEIAPIADAIAGLEMRSRIAILDSGNMERFRWLYDAFYRMNLQTDVLPAECLDFARYDYLVVPQLPKEEGKLSDALRSFVSTGGHLLGLCGNTDSAEMNPALRDVFGLFWEEATVPESLTIPGVGAVPAERMELLQLLTAEAGLRFDGPGWAGRTALAFNRFGKGGSAYLACLVSSDFEKVLSYILKQWCIMVPENRYPVVEKRGVNAKGKAVTFLLNYSSQPVTAHAPGTGTELLSGLPVAEGRPIQLPAFGTAILEG